MKLKYIIPAFALAATLAGCDENSFLDIKPQGTLSNSSLSNAKGVDLLTTAAYAALRNGDLTMPIKAVEEPATAVRFICWRCST